MSRAAPSGRDAERGPERVQVRGAEDDAVAGGDVDEVEVDPGPRDPARQVRKHPGAILGVDDDDLTFSRHSEVRDRQGVPGGAGVRDEDVELGAIARPDARRAAMFTPASLIAAATSASAPGVLSTSMIRSAATARAGSWHSESSAARAP